jgi:uncharacterized membrane protein YbhN (UPF0104 family)
MEEQSLSAGESRAAVQVDSVPAATSRGGKRRLRSIIAFALQVLVVGYMIHVLWKQRAEISHAFDLSILALVALTVLMFVTHVQRTYEFTFMLRRLGVHEPFGDGFLLTGAGFLLNQLPFNAGLVMRAAVLKRDHALPYTSYLALVLVNAVVNVSVAALLGLVAIWIEPLGLRTQLALTALFGAILLGGAFVTFLPKSLIPQGNNFVFRQLRILSEGLTMLRGGSSLALLFGLAMLKVVVSGGRMWICFDALNEALPPLAAALLASITVLFTLFNITPGNLGLRELALAGLSTHLATTYSVGMAAATIDRVVYFLYTLVIGLPGLYHLRKRGPFKG